MREGRSAAVAKIISKDSGRGHRQLTALDVQGGTGHFTGAESILFCGAAEANQAVAAGNLLSTEGVPRAVVAGFAGATRYFSGRLLATLRAGHAAGGDSRGLLSVALLVFEPRRAPLTLRVDMSDDPLSALKALHAARSRGAIMTGPTGFPCRRTGSAQRLRLGIEERREDPVHPDPASGVCLADQSLPASVVLLASTVALSDMSFPADINSASVSA